MSFEARYWGDCAACPERIIPGQDVTYTQDRELIHAVCVESDEPQRNERRCHCNLIHAGECP